MVVQEVKTHRAAPRRDAAWVTIAAADNLAGAASGQKPTPRYDGRSAIPTIVYSWLVNQSDGWGRAAGNLLLLARQKANLSQVQLAEEAGVPQSTISAYERGVRQPTLPTLFRLLIAAGFDLRLRLAIPDDQSKAAAEWAASRPAEERQRWSEEQDRVARGGR